MDNPTFVDEEDIPIVHQNDEDFDEYRTPDTSRVETSIIEHDTTEPTLTLQLRQKIKRDNLIALYRYLDVTGNPDLIDLDRFKLIKDSKKRSHNFRVL